MHDLDSIEESQKVTRQPPYPAEPDPTEVYPYDRYIEESQKVTRQPPYDSTTTEPTYVPTEPYPTEVYPYDPYEPYDPYDPYPFYFCELNEDEYGRPYYGPYDEYRPPYQPSATYPPPTQYPPTEPPTKYPPLYYVRPLTTTALPPPETYEVDLEGLAKKDSLSLPSCITSNECRESKGDIV